MNYRKFGNTELVVSEIGFGSWAIGGGAMIGESVIGWGPSDDRVSIAAIEAALERGINFFDTADIYGLGHSEDLLGTVIGERNDIILATKAGNVARDEKFTTDYSKDHILRACESSLRRLRREYIDFYQLHTARMPNLEQGDCIEAMEQLKKEGKIRYWGLSLNTFQPLPEAEYLISLQKANGFQLVLNILNQRALPILQPAGEKGYGVIARMPLQFGLLTGKFDKGASFHETDHRKNRLTDEVIEESNKALDRIWRLCEKYNCNKTQLALSYILSYPEVSTIIPGIRTPSHVADNTTGLFTLDGADRLLIEDLGRKELKEILDLIQSRG